jgi:hypothetical protein
MDDGPATKITILPEIRDRILLNVETAAPYLNQVGCLIDH